MKLEITVPSKTFLLGEYLTLTGGPALLLSTYPRFKMIVNNCKNSSVKMNIADHSPAAKFLRMNQNIFDKFSLNFIDPYSGLGGFGASSAQFCMLVALKEYLMKSELKIPELLNQYKSVSWNGSGYPPSGLDVISQLHGGLLYYHKRLNIIKKFIWPFSDLSICLIHTNNKILTHCYLEELLQLNVSGLKGIVDDALQALENRDKSAFCNAINSYSDALIKKKLTCDKTCDLLNLIHRNKNVIALKGCGALGADVICILIPNDSKGNFMKWAESENLNVIGIDNYVNEGVTIKKVDNQDQPEEVILVDKNDRQIGIEEKISAHKKALLHRAYSVFIFRENNGCIEVLLQQRARHKYHCPGLWSNACCSHPKPGEDISSSAQKRLEIEMGIKCHLYEVGSFRYKADVGNGLTEHEIDHIFIGKYSESSVYPNPDEVDSYQWIPMRKLLDDIQKNEHKYTPWLNEALHTILRQNILSQYLQLKETSHYDK